jgi:polyketide biosynthesis enoyl-CoA hydratase PksH
VIARHAVEAAVTRISFVTDSRSALTADRIGSALRDLEAEAAAIVLEGDADSFCTGLDLEGFAEERLDLAASSAEFGRLLAAIGGAKVPVIAKVDGEALGGGLGLVAVSDYAIAHPRARFGLPETMLGLIPAMVFPWIERRAGLTVARRLALGGAPLSAGEALQLGLIDEVSDDPGSAVGKVLDRLAKMDARSVAEIKRLIATHYAIDESWLSNAAHSFSALAASATTRRRIERFVACQAPWDEAIDER